MKKHRILYATFASLLFLLFFNTTKVKAQENANVYNEELGTFYTNIVTEFRLWSSTAKNIKIVVEGIEENMCNLENCNMTKDESTNLWFGSVYGDLLGKEYTYTIEYENGTVIENVIDPYSKYINESKDKSIIYDDNLITFEEWNNQQKSLKINNYGKIIYGLDVNNFTQDKSWNGSEENRSKLLGLIEEETKTVGGTSTGFDYIKNLGVTYIELNDIFDLSNPFSINKEVVTGENVYSGSEELKKIVNKYFLNKIGVILSFDYKKISNDYIENLKIIDVDGFVNESNCLDLNKKMTQNLIKQLLYYYVNSYKLSGLRIESMSEYPLNFANELSAMLVSEENDLIIYGDGSYKTLNENTAGENNLSKLNNIKMINGSYSYAMFGDLKTNNEKGIILGNFDKSMIETLKFTLLSSIDNGQIDYSLVKGISHNQSWGNNNSFQIVNYFGQRNGLSIYDKLYLNDKLNLTLLKQKIILALGSLMFSGGIPYIYSGNEFLITHRDTQKNENSICDNQGYCFYVDEEYKSINWSYAEINKNSVDNFKSLINYRVGNSFLTQTDAKIIKNNVDFYTKDELNGVIGIVRNYPNAYARDMEKVYWIINYSNNDYILNDFTGKGWKGYYEYNSPNRNGEEVVLKANSIYSETKEKQPKVSQWITLIFVIGIISLLYSANIFLNKRLVEKNGYDIKDIKRKYRPFIKKEKKSKENEEKETEAQDNQINEDTDQKE